MRIIFITKCLFIYFSLIYRKNLVESIESSSNPGTQGGTEVTTTAGGTDSGSKTGVELSLKAKNPTNEFDRNENNKVVTFTAKGNNAFKSVKTGDIVIWRTDNASEYATKVVLNGKGKKDKIVTIYLLNGIIKVFNRGGKGKEWKVSVQAGTESVTKNPNKLDSDSNLVDLDITKITDTQFYTFKTIIGQYGATNSSSYSPKGTYLFKSVMDGSKYIWKADDVNKCSNKVNVYQSLYPNVTNVWITFPDGIKKHFYKRHKMCTDGNWTEITDQANRK